MTPREKDIMARAMQKLLELRKAGGLTEEAACAAVDACAAALKAADTRRAAAPAVVRIEKGRRKGLVRAAEELGVGRRHLAAWLEGRRESKSLEARARKTHPELLALRKTRRPIEAPDGVRLTLADLIAAWRKLTRDEQRRFMVAISTEIATASERSPAHERRPL